jgi:hypothetical protein
LSKEFKRAISKALLLSYVDILSTKMRAKICPPLGLALFIALFLSTFAAAAPQGSAPPPPPDCPLGSHLAGSGRDLIRTYYSPSISEAGGYRLYTEKRFADEFTITDLTPDYPARQKGKKYPPPGTYATSRLQFADLFQKYINKPYEFFGNVQIDDRFPYGGAAKPGDCFTYEWESTYGATMLKPYG